MVKEDFDNGMEVSEELFKGNLASFMIVSELSAVNLYMRVIVKKYWGKCQKHFAVADHAC